MCAAGTVVSHVGTLQCDYLLDTGPCKVHVVTLGTAKQLSLAFMECYGRMSRNKAVLEEAT